MWNFAPIKLDRTIKTLESNLPIPSVKVKKKNQVIAYVTNDDRIECDTTLPPVSPTRYTGC